MNWTNIPPDSAFICHGHLQQTGTLGSRKHCLLFHIYQFTEDVRAHDAVSFSCLKSIGIEDKPVYARGDKESSAVVPGTESARRYDCNREQALSIFEWGTKREPEFLFCLVCLKVKHSLVTNILLGTFKTGLLPQVLLHYGWCRLKR